MIRKLSKGEHQKYYLRDGAGPLPGASTICKIGDDPGGLIHWAWKKGSAGEDYRKERDDAAEAGDIGHGLIEAYFAEDELDISDYPPELQKQGRTCFDKFMDWWDKRGLTLLHAELQLVSHAHRYGGTLDLLCKDKDGGINLIDFKTTKALRVSHTIQAGGYGLLVNENFPENPVDEICILRLPKDGKKVEPLWIDPINFPVYHKLFLANLAAWYARKEFNRVDPIAIEQSKWRSRKK